MSNKEVRAYLARIGSKGGKASRRTLTSEQAKAMVNAREAKRPKKPNASVRRPNAKRSDASDAFAAAPGSGAAK